VARALGNASSSRVPESRTIPQRISPIPIQNSRRTHVRSALRLRFRLLIGGYGLVFGLSLLFLAFLHQLVVPDHLADDLHFAAKSYKKIEVNEQCEVLSAVGDVAIGDDGKASLHFHIVLGLSDGSTRGGHLLAGTVRPTLEAVLTEVPSKLRRKKRADLGIALIDVSAS
jgi:Plants and Prokaryotes Conserved (PCC) domain